MNLSDLAPHEVVLDLVLKYSATMPREDHAAVLGDNLIILARNHLGIAWTLSFPVHFYGNPLVGDATTPPRFVLRKLGSTVWKLAPSIKHDMLHAYVTIVEVPEDVTWGKSS